jgi:hypothetical protein
MPTPIIILYVILILRVIVNAVLIINSFPSATPAASISGTFAVLDFALCLTMLIALFERKLWLALFFRIYVGVVMLRLPRFDGHGLGRKKEGPNYEEGRIRRGNAPAP